MTHGIFQHKYNFSKSDVYRLFMTKFSYYHRHNHNSDSPLLIAAKATAPSSHATMLTADIFVSLVATFSSHNMRLACVRTGSGIKKRGTHYDKPRVHGVIRYYKFVCAFISQR